LQKTFDRVQRTDLPRRDIYIEQNSLPDDRQGNLLAATEIITRHLTHRSETR
jgi:hypothetical protein